MADKNKGKPAGFLSRLFGKSDAAPSSDITPREIYVDKKIPTSSDIPKDPEPETASDTPSKNKLPFEFSLLTSSELSGIELRVALIKNLSAIDHQMKAVFQGQRRHEQALQSLIINSDGLTAPEIANIKSQLEEFGDSDGMVVPNGKNYTQTFLEFRSKDSPIEIDFLTGGVNRRDDEVTLIVDDAKVLSTRLYPLSFELEGLTDDALVEINDRALAKLHTELQGRLEAIPKALEDLQSLKDQVADRAEKARLEDEQKERLASIARRSSNKQLDGSLREALETLKSSRKTTSETPVSKTSGLAYNSVSAAIKHLVVMPIPHFEEAPRSDDHPLSKSRGADVYLVSQTEPKVVLKTKSGIISLTSLNAEDEYDTNALEEVTGVTTTPDLFRTEYRFDGNDIVLSVDRVEYNNDRGRPLFTDINYTISADGDVIDSGKVVNYGIVSEVRGKDFEEMDVLSEICSIASQDFQEMMPSMKSLVKECDAYDNGMEVLKKEQQRQTEIEDNSQRVIGALANL